MKQNCWDYKKCGRQENGINVGSMGICPAYTEQKYNNNNNGINAGRYCWKVAGTLCEGKIQGTYANKLHNCIKCDFFIEVKAQEGMNFLA